LGFEQTVTAQEVSVDARLNSELVILVTQCCLVQSVALDCQGITVGSPSRLPERCTGFAVPVTLWQKWQAASERTSSSDEGLGDSPHAALSHSFHQLLLSLIASFTDCFFR